MGRPVQVSVGVDIGGTFTDVVLFMADDRQSSMIWTKAPSTPRRPVQGVLNAVEKGLSQANCRADDVAKLMHATTVGTNAVLEQKGAKLGLLMTEGFEDVLEIGRQKRSQLYEIFLEPETPTFLCPRNRRMGVDERVAYDGSVLVPIDQADLRDKLKKLQELNVEAIAVCYLFSFQNPQHELLTRELIRSENEQIQVSLSHEINPVFREYERLCVTAFDAYLRPVMSDYLGELLSLLRSKDITGTVQTMKSRGGLASIEGALERPVTTMLSGPAAGVIGARFVAKTAGIPNVITLDMGGTSADIAVVKEGKPLTSTSGGIGRYPLNIPTVDVQTIGAGGGSIAWLDDAKGLRVGPMSAGSDPGPACYGLGGEEPTVTDASLVLGYLDPEYFLGGGRSLNVKAAHAAIKKIARPLGMTTIEAALGIHRIVNAKMADAIRLASVKRGYDIRQFSLMAFGGAGPVNGSPLADDLGMTRCVVPRSPGVLSALGLLVSDVEYDNAQTFLAPLNDVDSERVNHVFNILKEIGLKQMANDGHDESECVIRYSADMRYVGQSSELEISMPYPFRADKKEDVAKMFQKEHERVYGYAPVGTPIEFVNLRTVHLHHSDLPIAQSLLEINSKKDPSESSAGPTGHRQCHFSEGEFQTPSFGREDLGSDEVIEGPAIIQQEDTTVVVYPQHSCRVDDFGNLLMERSGKNS